MRVIRQGHHEKRGATLWYKRLGTIALFIVVVLMARSAWGVYTKGREAADNRARAEMQLADVTARQLALQAKIDHLRTPDGLEAAMREQFQMGKPGEGVIVIVDAKPSTSSSTAATASWWHTLTGWLTGH